MIQLSCTLEEYYQIIGSKIKNDVIADNKLKKEQLDFIYEHYNNKVSKLITIYKEGIIRKKIIKNVLKNYKNNEKCHIPNLKKMLDELKKNITKMTFFFIYVKNVTVSIVYQGQENQ